MKILHTADWHLGAYVGPQCDDPYKRMENTIKCLDKLVETAWQEKPDIILIPGDVFHSARVWDERRLVEIRVAVNCLKELGMIAPVVVLYGTPSHENMETFYTLQEMLDGFQVGIHTEPFLRRISTKTGAIQVAGLPGFDKGHFRAQFPGLSAEEENKVFTEQLTQILQGLSAQVDPNIPSVLMAHHTVVGCELDNGQHVFQANEIVLPAAALDSSNFDMVCLGHIHKAQKVTACRKPVYYSGSIDAFTFNDEGHEHGFWIHRFFEWNAFPQYSRTPAREFLTCKWDDEATKEYASGEWQPSFDDLLCGGNIKDKVVRILYACDSETEKALNKKKLEQDLYAAGAYYVSEIRPEKVTASVNREGMTEKLTVSECLDRYLKEKKKTEEEISAILSEAVDIVAEAQASMPMGSSSGMFLPVEIEVRNYRSYAEEKFSFEDIFFAMVNGKNGSGKSSLFMDAITDCLYEETREKELTGWIRNDTKSGSISFTFRLGGDLWRVTRTRQRSGKATLALAKFLEENNINPAQWIDHSTERLNDTQQKIIDLLGMDCDTFQSCVLIMQDRYGKFMEADKSERMAVLANLLGLGIYDDLLKITKEKLTDVNREVRAGKEEILALEAEVAGEEDLHAEMQQAEVELRTTQDELQENKEQLNALHSKIGAIAGYEEEESRLKNDLKSDTESYAAKKDKRDDLQRRVEETKSFLQNEQNILDKCAELDAARMEIASLDGKVRILEDKQQQCGKTNRELLMAQGQRENIAIRLDEIEARLVDKSRLESIVEGNTAEAELEEYEKKVAEAQELNNQKQALVSKFAVQEKELMTEIAIRVSKLDGRKKEAEMLNNANCLDVEKANCRFLQSAKEAKEKVGHLENQINEQQAYLARKQEEQNIAIAEIDEKIKSIAYDRITHSELIQTVHEYHNAKDELAKLAADSATAKELEKQEGALDGRVKELEENLEILASEIAALEQETGKVAELKSLIVELAGYESMKEQLPKAKQFVESTGESIDQLSADINELASTIKQINDRLAELALLTVDKGALYARKRDIETRIIMLETLISALNQQIGTINANLKTIDAKKVQLAEKQEKLQQAARQAANLEVLAQAFSQDGIPYQIIRDIVPELEAAANEILSQMTGGRMRLEFVTEKTLKSNKAKEVATLEIIISDVDNGVLPYLSRSGGQKVRAALAVNFALANIKASRVGLQLGMMFVDEPPFLDADGVEAYCAALEVQHEKFPEMRIVAISHDENMKARFPQQIQIEVGENGSRVMRS
ncbi:MAG: exonuclease subunit SbcD [Dehalococcoidia bacterium]|nr:exonuclease subunit SbcD [Dehalococcoidia bacterium]